MAAMRNHWDRSPHDPYTRHNPDEPWRPIALLRTGMGHGEARGVVFRVRSLQPATATPR